MRTVVMTAASAALAFAFVSSPAAALTMKECSTKYQAAKAAGDTSKWPDFRKAQCGPTASAAPATAPTATAAPAPAGSAAPAPTIRTAAPTAPARNAAPAPGDITYPSAVDPKYASESAGKGRMHTCLDAYKAAKAAGSLGSMKWIEKGGGYYSTCNARLKG